MKYFHKENPYLEGLINNYFEKLNNYNEQYFNGELSVILLGSLSRGEATWIKDEDEIKLISDIEYFTVYPDGFSDFDKYSSLCETAKEEVFSKQKSSLFHIDNTFVRRSRLPFMERKLITYDAKCMGKTVVGKDYIHMLPEISLDNINLWDIKDILTHRVFFVLYYGEGMTDKENNNEYRYLLAKNSLDLMTVLLAHHKKLESGFIKRLEVVKTLDISDEWKKYFEYCLSVKLCESETDKYSVLQMEQIFISIVKKLAKSFSVPLKNALVNKNKVFKRCMGIIKRSVKTRNIVCLGHLKRLIKLFENGKVLTTNINKDNYVLNGYPKI